MNQLKLMLLGLVFLVGCATAKLPAGPDIYKLTNHPDAKIIGVVDVHDARTNKTAGSVGAASITVGDDLAELVTKNLINRFNKEGFNVRRVDASAVSAPKDFNVDYVLKTDILAVKLFSIDAILQPVDTSITLKADVYDQDGKLTYSDSFEGKARKQVGLSFDFSAEGDLVQEATLDAIGRLVESKVLAK